MSIDMLNMALFFINRSVKVNKIENNKIEFSNGIIADIPPLANNYALILAGKEPTSYQELYSEFYYG